MNVSGKIVEVFDVMQISEKFKKRDFIVEIATNPKYPEVIKFELHLDKVSMIDGIHEGDEVIVEFNLKGRKWVNPQGKAQYFNTLQAWKVEKLAGMNQDMSNGPNAMGYSVDRHASMNPPWQQDAPKPPPPTTDDQDNLPF